jgi:hypothetical protein
MIVPDIARPTGPFAEYALVTALVVLIRPGCPANCCKMLHLSAKGHKKRLPPVRRQPYIRYPIGKINRKELNYASLVSPALMNSRFIRAILATEIPLGHSASQA